MLTFRGAKRDKKNTGFQGAVLSVSVFPLPPDAAGFRVAYRVTYFVAFLVTYLVTYFAKGVRCRRLNRHTAARTVGVSRTHARIETQVFRVFRTPYART